MEKSILILFIALGICKPAIGQYVSVELAVSWQRDNFVLEGKKKNYCYPSLEITYRNNSSQPLYFLKVLHPYRGLPRTYYTTLVHLSRGTPSRGTPPFDYNHTNENYTVHFSDYPGFNQLWDILSDSINIKERHFDDFVNDELCDIYHNIFGSLLDKERRSKHWFKESDFIFKEYPEKQVKNKFVFLKPGESYTDTVNLIGFLLIGGNYTFKIPNNILKSYVLGESMRNAEGKFEYPKIPLPPVIKEYKLYDGAIRTNEVRVCLKKEATGK